jgi:hypothetical protein
MTDNNCHHLGNGDLVLCAEGKRLGDLLSERLNDLMEGGNERFWEPYYQATQEYQAHVNACEKKS